MFPNTYPLPIEWSAPLFTYPPFSPSLHLATSLQTGPRPQLSDEWGGTFLGPENFHRSVPCTRVLPIFFHSRYSSFPSPLRGRSQSHVFTSLSPPPSLHFIGLSKYGFFPPSTFLRTGCLRKPASPLGKPPLQISG